MAVGYGASKGWSFYVHYGLTVMNYNQSVISVFSAIDDNLSIKKENISSLREYCRVVFKLNGYTSLTVHLGLTHISDSRKS